MECNGCHDKVEEKQHEIRRERNSRDPHTVFSVFFFSMKVQLNGNDRQKRLKGDDVKKRLLTQPLVQVESLKDPEKKLLRVQMSFEIEGQGEKKGEKTGEEGRGKRYERETHRHFSCCSRRLLFQPNMEEKRERRGDEGKDG